MTVLFRGGTYPVHETVIFGLADSAPAGTQTRYAAFPDEEPIFSAAAPVDDWRRLTEYPERLSQKARGHVWVADVTAILRRRVPQEPLPHSDPEEVELGELLQNGDFSQGRKDWDVYAANAKTEKLAVSVQPRITGRTASLRVISGRSHHHLQFRQAVNVTKGGTYTWRFTASADQATVLPVRLLEQSPPHRAVITSDLALSREPKTFELRGVAPSDLLCVASFQVGGTPGRKIQLQAVSLTGPMTRNKHARRPTYATAGRFFTVFAGSDRLPRARSRGFRQTNRVGGWHDGSHRDLHFPPGAFRDGQSVRDTEVVVIPRAQWVQNVLPVTSVNEETRVAELAYPASYALAYCGAGHGSTVWVENRLDDLDSPGEWALDSAAGRLYLWPRGNRPQDIRVPLLTEMLRIEGQINPMGPTDTPARGLHFEGITFSHAERYSWHGRSGWGLQHDWEAFDAASAMVRLRGAEECVFTACRFIDSGSTGLRLDLHAQQNVVRGCVFAHLGGVGLLLAGYGPGAKDVNKRNEFTDNYIHHIGETYWASPGIFVWQSGENRIAHNTIRHTPYTAIVVSARAGLSREPSPRECSATIRDHEIEDSQRGNWEAREPLLHGRMNVIEYNDISQVMQRLGDGNGIYISGTGKENRVQFNYVHDCPSPHMAEGIRCDDDQYDTIIHGNVIWGMGGHATGITIKGRNTITNNIIGAPIVPRTARGFISLELGTMEGSVIERNVLLATRRNHHFVFQRRLYGSGETPRMRDAQADRNLYWCREAPARANAFLESERAHGIEKTSRVADPELRDPLSGDFRFKSSSAALAMGIEPVDVASCGLRSPYRKRYIKEPLAVRIDPPGGILMRPLRVTMIADQPEAAIRYTTNGTLPSLHSTTYDRPFEIDEACELRARGFLQGFEDTNGATALFLPPPDPLTVDFPRLQSLSDDVRLHVRAEEGRPFGITLAQVGTDRKGLRFTDGPGQKYDFNPHLEIPFTMKVGGLRGRISLRVDAATHVYCQWRRHRPGPLKAGPTFYIRPGGRLGTENGHELMRVPVSTWLRIEMEGSFGTEQANRFTLRVEVEGVDTVREFTDLPTRSGDFREMDSLFIVAQGIKKAAFDVREIALTPVLEE
ncbi:MAG: hypothetical protein HN742_19200 [Lentisphaerae bacterium]|nr:hypothetical protein [Lentisphaerota bacterium]MBT4817250.1 hypothetical protein [Lentisphaerota bacterium]MBT5608464.1 hypothetical protein [Lentisphaerota bacterium]MBT7060286.1 hypothetical protein [Lentisphaerota bacterium]MBT7844015.1 hypothetical protein [Lentisphaerota bacterium]